MKRPLVYFVAPLLCALFIVSDNIGYYYLASLCFITLLLILSVKDKYKLYMLIIFVICSLYFYAYNYEYSVENNLLKGEQKFFTATIFAQEHNGYILKNLRVSEKTFYFKVKIYSDDKYNIGDEVTGYIAKNENTEYKNDGAFSYRDYLKANKTLCIVDANIIKREKTNKYFFLKYLNKYRQSINNTINHGMKKHSDIMAAILLGTDIETDLESVIKAGVIHIFAISGLHLAIISLLIYRISKFIFVSIRSRSISVIILTALYIALSGFHLSTIRAGFMILLFFLKNVLYRKYDNVSALSFAFITMMLINPYSYLNRGFVLSFSAVISIFFIRKHIAFSNLDSYYTKTMNTLLAVHVGMLPVIAHYTFEVYTYSVLTNFLVLPLVPVIIISGYIASIMPSFVSEIIFLIPHYLIEYILRLSEIIISLPFSTLLVGKVQLPTMLMYYLSIFMYQSRKKISILFAILVLFITVKGSIFPKEEVVFLDIGNGDSTIIRTEGYSILIDGGGIPFRKGNNQGLRVLLPYLKSAGIASIDSVIITHSDFDHIYGIIEILGMLPVRQIIVSDYYKERDDFLFNELRKKAKNYGVNIVYIKNEDEIVCGQSKLKFYTPYDKSSKVSNNQSSLMTIFKTNDKKFLFLGDCEKEEEKFLVNNYKDEITDIDVLKVAHHGSATSSSSEFLEVAKPKLSILTVGEKNRFGHPKKEVVERLEEYGLLVLETYETGQIEVTTSSGKIKYKTYVNEEISRTD